MWIFMNDSFVSIVKYTEDGVGARPIPAYGGKDQLLLVRARRRACLTALFPKWKRFIQRTPKADYLYRIVLLASDVYPVVLNRIAGIDYNNFKGSVANKRRHDVYMKVWQAHNTLDERDDARVAAATPQHKTEIPGTGDALYNVTRKRKRPAAPRKLKKGM